MSLFDAPSVVADRPGLVRHDARATSRSAAVATWPTTGTARGRVLAFVAARGGATDEEIIAGLTMSPNTARPRRVELVRDGLLVDSGETRSTGSGQAAVVWTLSGRGRMEYARHLAGA